jgi:RimJ/RimL family protein N-acetyltransferase
VTTSSASFDVHLDPTRIRLRDGAVADLRRLSASDYDAVVRLSEALTGRERYLRFFQVRPGRLDQWARSLTEPPADLFAMGVFEDGDLIGVGNFALTSTPGSAEIAVLVAHEQHDRGVGTALLEALGDQARDQGVQRFVADVLAENHSMLRVLSDAGWPCTLHLNGWVFHVETKLQP